MKKIAIKTSVKAGNGVIGSGAGQENLVKKIAIRTNVKAGSQFMGSGG